MIRSAADGWNVKGSPIAMLSIKPLNPSATRLVESRPTPDFVKRLDAVSSLYFQYASSSSGVSLRSSASFDNSTSRGSFQYSCSSMFMSFSSSIVLSLDRMAGLVN